MTDDELLAAWKAGKLRVIGCDQCNCNEEPYNQDLGDYPPAPRNYEKCSKCGEDLILRHVCNSSVEPDKFLTCPPMSNSVAALASKANAASNKYRELVDAKASYYVLRSAGNELRAATDALVAAIADAMS